MSAFNPFCLILACGNSLREDDGVGPLLAQWAAQRFSAEPRVQVISRQQWTPELAEDIAAADCVLFIDCSIIAPAGQVTLTEVVPVKDTRAHATHHLDAALLLSLAQDLYSSRPRKTSLLTIGAGSVELRQGLSDPVRAALPKACSLIESTVRQELGSR